MTIMIIFGSFLPSLLVGLAPPIYSDLGADIVYGIITLIIRVKTCTRLVSTAILLH